jgi:hypothetical protein
MRVIEQRSMTEPEMGFGHLSGGKCGRLGVCEEFC